MGFVQVVNEGASVFVHQHGVDDVTCQPSMAATHKRDLRSLFWQTTNSALKFVFFCVLPKMEETCLC